MRSTILLFAIAATLLAFALVNLFRPKSPPQPIENSRSTKTEGPELLPALVGRNGILEVIVVRRQATPELQRFSDRVVSEKLGLDPREHFFVELTVSNISDSRQAIAQAALRLEAGNGEGVSSFGLLDHPAKSPEAMPLLLALAGSKNDLEPRHIRRIVLGVQSAKPFDAFASASFAGLLLEPKYLSRRKYEEHFEKASPSSALIAEVVEKDRIPGREEASITKQEDEVGR